MDACRYSSYTFRQLYEALDSIRGDLYPEALATLQAEISRRRDVPKAELEEAYFRLDHDKYPGNREDLAALINDLGGFETIAPEVVTNENRYHTGWRRFWALIFDSLILQLVLSVVALPFTKQNPGNVVIITTINFVAQLLVILYFVLMHATSGQTLGKMITGVRVVRVSDESQISLLRALARDFVPLALLTVSILALPYSDIIVSSGDTPALKPPPLAMGVSLFALLWGLVEVLTMLFSKKRRALHDLIAGTVVVRYLRPQRAALEDGVSLMALDGQ